MSLKFSAGEVFQMAQDIERNGARFYRKAAEGFRDSPSHAMLLELAAMEDDHLATFTDMKNHLAAREQESPVFDPFGESELYLRAMASTHVFDTSRDPSESLTGEETLQEILKMAIKLEKDSIIFYLGLKSAIVPNMGKERLDDVIAQEFSHISMLSDRLTELRR
ncbi:MAG: ferritin family protein [Candidatus Eisenbacteria bacterium]|jgi:rubrerythrin|nr:ferritin family protein [Candidatus Eisenbacteria bacterium]